MNGRQRSPRGIRSHESGSTTRKKIAKVAVGKSTEEAQPERKAAVSMTGRACGGIYADEGGGKRVAVLSSTPAISSAVRSTGGANHDGSSGGGAAPGVMEP